VDYHIYQKLTVLSKFVTGAIGQGIEIRDSIPMGQWSSKPKPRFWSYSCPRRQLLLQFN